jgi:hypothetical protein
MSITISKDRRFVVQMPESAKFEPGEDAFRNANFEITGTTDGKGHKLRTVTFPTNWQISYLGGQTFPQRTVADFSSSDGLGVNFTQTGRENAVLKLDKVTPPAKLEVKGLFSALRAWFF